MSKKPSSKKRPAAPRAAPKPKAKASVKALPKSRPAPKPAKKAAPKQAKAKPTPKTQKTPPRPSSKKTPEPATKPAKKPAASHAVAKPAPKPAATPKPAPSKPAPSSKTVKNPPAKTNANPAKKPLPPRKADRVATKAAGTPRVAFSLEEALELAKSAGGKQAAPAPAAEIPAPAPAPKVAKRKLGATEPVKVEARKLGAASLADILGFDVQGGVDPEKAEAKTIPEKWHRYYKLLVELRRHIKEGLMLHSEETLMKSAKEDSGDLSGYSQHMADAGTDTFDRDFALSVVANEQEALNEIEGAIKRMQLGTYGVCEYTGKPIAKERLLAVPFARYSVESQAEVEKARRQRAARGLGILEFDDEEGGPAPANGGGGDDDGEE